MKTIDERLALLSRLNREHGTLFDAEVPSELLATIRAQSSSGRSRAEIAAELDCLSDPTVVGSIQAALGSPAPRPSGVLARN